MQLVITEKPSVAKAISSVIGAWQRHDGYLEGSGYIVSWCVGHLVALAEPHLYEERYRKWRMEDLPIVPTDWKYQVSEGTKKQFYVLKKLMERSDVEEIICATDAGREGELIFRLVYEQAGCRKPFRRLWINSMEDAAIRDGFSHLRDGHEYDSLYAAARARARADWLVGINGTRLFTKRYNQKLTVGRVQTPALAMLTERQTQISCFQKQKYWNVHLKLGDVEVVKEKIFDEKEAEALAEACENSSAVVTSAESREHTVRPPKLYDLTTLQREANRYYGYTASETLEIIQELYEQQLVTYPRTDSQYLPEDMADTAEEMIQIAEEIYGEDILEDASEEEPEILLVLDSKKVTDHHAIIPTGQIAKKDLDRLSENETRLLLLIVMRFLAATRAKQRIQETEVKVSCAGEEFTAKGKRVLEKGWKVYEESFRRKAGLKPLEEENEFHLDTLSKGQEYEHPKTELTAHFTSPPKAYTDGTLLSSMETAGNESFDEDTEKKGLGTPATRAEIIEKLVCTGYVQRKGKQLIPTGDGMALVQVLPEAVKSPKLTADWENALKQIKKGAITEDEFMSGIIAMVKGLVTKYGSLPEDGGNPFSGKDGSGPQREEIGKCPRCGSSVFEGQKNYYCSSRACSFCLWKETKWLTGMRKKLTKKMAAALLADGRVHVTGLYSERKGRNFDADLVMEDDGERVGFRLDFNRNRVSKKRKG